MKLIEWIRKRLCRKQPQTKLYNSDATANKETGRRKYEKY